MLGIKLWRSWKNICVHAIHEHKAECVYPYLEVDRNFIANIQVKINKLF